LLAFSNRVRENTHDALMTFTTYRTILETKITDDLIHPPESYSNPILQELASNHSVKSFKYFLPFSDSVFIASDNPDSFIKQLGAFILHCFTFTSSAYQNPDDKSNPTKVTTTKVDISADGKVVSREKESNWYPTLFRGGVAFGEAIPIELIGIVKNRPEKIANLAGKAVIKAVGLESKIKGPRIIFEKEYYDKLQMDTKKYVLETEVKGLYELLWPAFLYSPSNGETEINKFCELFLPAVNLWQAYNHTSFAEHYFKFVELIIMSTIKIFEASGHTDTAVNKITDMIKSRGLEHKIKHLLKSYYR